MDKFCHSSVVKFSLDELSKLCFWNVSFLITESIFFIFLNTVWVCGDYGWKCAFFIKKKYWIQNKIYKPEAIIFSWFCEKLDFRLKKSNIHDIGLLHTSRDRKQNPHYWPIPGLYDVQRVFFQPVVRHCVNAMFVISSTRQALDPDSKQPRRHPRRRRRLRESAQHSRGCRVRLPACIVQRRECLKMYLPVPNRFRGAATCRTWSATVLLYAEFWREPSPPRYPICSCVYPGQNTLMFSPVRTYVSLIPKKKYHRKARETAAATQISSRFAVLFGSSKNGERASGNPWRTLSTR